MVDIVDRKTRSRMMASIRGHDTGIELQVRRGLHRLGFRYRLGGAGLPGKPDIVLPKYHTVVFVHGCFWHGHDCALFRLPKTRPEFWRHKIEANRERDHRNLQKLEKMGWRTLTIWECSLRGKKQHELTAVVGKIEAWLMSSATVGQIKGSRND